MSKESLELAWLDDGGVTSPEGFIAGASYAGIKTYGPEPRLDVGLLASETECAAAGVFTQNRIVGAPVELCRERIARGKASAIVVNSGCSNVGMGEPGRKAAERMAEAAARRLGIEPAGVLVASTGVIGRPLPIEQLETNIAALSLDRPGGALFSRAIMTTDTIAKQRAASVTIAGRTYTIGGTAKGAGMVHPDMATVLCFVTTNAAAESAWLQSALKRAADVSLNMIDVDMDTSTSDTMLLFANGAAGGEPVSDGHPAAEALQAALDEVCIALARDLARDGEGARTLIEVVVQGARTEADARRAARTVCSSPLVKTMVAGRDPNAGRILMAIGRSGADVDIGRLRVFVGECCAFDGGKAPTADYAEQAASLNHEEVRITVDLGLGVQTATAWGCDLTEEYVRINASYTT